MHRSRFFHALVVLWWGCNAYAGADAWDPFLEQSHELLCENNRHRVRYLRAHIQGASDYSPSDVSRQLAHITLPRRDTVVQGLYLECQVLHNDILLLPLSCYKTLRCGLKQIIRDVTVSSYKDVLSLNYDLYTFINTFLPSIARSAAIVDFIDYEMSWATNAQPAALRHAYDREIRDIRRTVWLTGRLLETYRRARTLMWTAVYLGQVDAPSMFIDSIETQDLNTPAVRDRHRDALLAQELHFTLQLRT